MKNMFTLIMVLILLFSFGIGGYISFFKFPLKDTKLKMLAFLMVGAAATAFTFVVCLAVIWPPVRM